MSLSLHPCFLQALLCIYLSVSLLPACSLQNICLFFLSADIQSSRQATNLVSLSVGFIYVICLLYFPAFYSSATLSAYLFYLSADYPNIFFYLPLLSVFLPADLSDYLAVYILFVSWPFYVLSLCMLFTLFPLYLSAGLLAVCFSD